MIRHFSAILFLCIQCVRAVEVQVPEGWSRMEAPAHMPPSSKPMVRVAPPAKSGHVFISGMEAGMSLDEAADSYARSMPMRGISIQSNAGVTQGGHAGKHITGRLSVAGNDVAVPVEVYVVSTPEGIVCVELTGEEVSSKIEEVWKWIEFGTADVREKSPNAPASGGRSLAEYIGMAVVFGAVGYAIFKPKSSGGKVDKKP